MPATRLRPDSSPDAEAIVGGAAALHVALDAVQAEQVAAYARLLARWNATHNLTAIRAGGETLTHHLLDSLSIVPHFLHVTGGGSVRVLDVGSGGGLPGIILAIAVPQARLTLVDAVRKKCAFLTQAKLELGLRNVEVLHARVETMREPMFDVIISRALATLDQFVRWTRQLLKPGGCWLAMKGKTPAEELAALPPEVGAAVVPVPVPGLGEERHLIEMRLR